MRSETPRPRKPGVFNREGLPIIGTFLIWGTGSGAQTLARPLFAYDVAGSVFLVTVLIAALAGSLGGVALLVTIAGVIWMMLRRGRGPNGVRESA